jgi:monofunctional biosynthetic peptidoglycan transglycosylase
MITVLKRVFLGAAAAFILFLIAFAMTFLIYNPDVTQMKGCFTTSLYHVDVCPKKSSYVKLSGISRLAQRAIIVSEDGSFYSHNGFDWFEMKQSFYTNLENMSYTRGGSTITQQVAKNAFLSADKTIFRKLLEAYTTYKIEKTFTKDQILEKYLNMVEFGPNLYGIKNASLRYFHKPPSRIHLLEAVWLAHLLPNPKVYSKTMSRGQLTSFSEKRVRILLQRLLKYGDINKDQFEFAVSRISDFPWQDLSIEDFNAPAFDPSEQQKALDELMNSKDWVEDTPENEEPQFEDSL